MGKVEVDAVGALDRLVLEDETGERIWYRLSKARGNHIYLDRDLLTCSWL